MEPADWQTRQARLIIVTCWSAVSIRSFMEPGGPRVTGESAGQRRPTIFVTSACQWSCCMTRDRVVCKVRQNGHTKCRTATDVHPLTPGLMLPHPAPPWCRAVEHSNPVSLHVVFRNSVPCQSRLSPASQSMAASSVSDGTVQVVCLGSSRGGHRGEEVRYSGRRGSLAGWASTEVCGVGKRVAEDL